MAAEVVDGGGLTGESLGDQEISEPVDATEKPEGKGREPESGRKKPNSKPEEKSGIRKRLKINVPGLIKTDQSSNKPPREFTGSFFQSL